MLVPLDFQFVSELDNVVNYRKIGVSPRRFFALRVVGAAVTRPTRCLLRSRLQLASPKIDSVVYWRYDFCRTTTKRLSCLPQGRDEQETA